MFNAPMTNADRASRAEAALLAYIGGGPASANSLETWLGDLLCDLRHLADGVGVEFNPDAGAMNYQAEIDADEPGEFLPAVAWTVDPAPAPPNPNRAPEGRAAKALSWVARYNAELDAQIISPNGSDFVDLAEGVTAILETGAVPAIKVSPAGR